MGTTTIKRKALRNRVKAKQRIASIKRLTSKPTLKNIDTEEIKSTFVNKAPKKETHKKEVTAKPEAIKKEKTVVEPKTTQKAETKVEKAKEEKPVVESKSTPKAGVKVEKVKEEKSDSVKANEKKSDKSTKKPVAKEE